MGKEAKIIFENDQVIVIYKPAGMPVQTSKVSERDVCSQLKNHLKGGYLGVIHRLDQPVEGLLVFAKDKKTAAYLTEELGKGRLKKSYKAVCMGTCIEGGVSFCHMRKNPDSYCEIMERQTGENINAFSQDEYKLAETEYKVLANRNGTTCFEINIQTGRFHQIRAHMSYLGFPILGDMKYGSSESIALSQKMSIRFPALCAHSISFYDPVNGELKCFTADPENNAFDIYK